MFLAFPAHHPVGQLRVRHEIKHLDHAIPQIFKTSPDDPVYFTGRLFFTESDSQAFPGDPPLSEREPEAHRDQAAREEFHHAKRQTVEDPRRREQAVTRQGPLKILYITFKIHENSTGRKTRDYLTWAPKSRGSSRSGVSAEKASSNGRRPQLLVPHGYLHRNLW